MSLQEKPKIIPYSRDENISALQQLYISLSEVLHGRSDEMKPADALKILRKHERQVRGLSKIRNIELRLLGADLENFLSKQKSHVNFFKKLGNWFKR